MSKSGYHHGDLRNAMLDAADQLLASQGLQGFTLRGCARLAGVSHAAPKHHFGDVRGLLSAVAARGFERLQATLKQAIEQVGEDLDAQMQATTTAYVQFAQDNPEHFRVMFRADLLRLPDGPGPPEPMRETFRVLTNVILSQRGEPLLQSSEVVNLVGFSLINDILIGWCHIHGFAHLLMEGQLAMVPPGELPQHIQRTSVRLAQAIRSHALASR